MATMTKEIRDAFDSLFIQIEDIWPNARSKKQADAEYKRLKAQWAKLEELVGRKVTEDEIAFTPFVAVS